MTREELLTKAKPILFNTEMVKAILEGRKTVTRRVIKRDISNRFDCEADGTAIAYIDQATGDSYKLWEVCRFKKGDYLYVRETWCWCPCWDCGMDSEEGCCDKNAEKFYHSERHEYGCYGYRASFVANEEPFERWYPSIHMPKEAARIFLKVTDVRVERLQDITEEQAKAEGISRLFDYMSDKDYEDWMKQLGQSEKTKSDWDYKNYLWHGDYGTTGQGNKKTDNWAYQYSAYDSAVDSFSSLWNTTVELKDWDTYGWEANPWVWVIEFERVEV